MSTPVLRSLIRPAAPREKWGAAEHIHAAVLLLSSTSWHRLGPGDMPLEAKRCRHGANRAIPSRTRPCTSSCLERFPLRGHPPDPSPPRAGAAYRREGGLVLPPQEPHAIVPARMAR